MKGIVLQVSESEVIVDVGYKSEGIIPIGEAVADGDTLSAAVFETFNVYFKLYDRLYDAIGCQQLDEAASEAMIAYYAGLLKTPASTATLVSVGVTAKYIHSEQVPRFDDIEEGR